MTGKAVGWAFDQPVDNPTRKLVLVCLADGADHYGICFPGFGSIAKKTSLSRDTVIRSIKDLEKAGLLERVNRPTGTGRWTSNAYKLPFYNDCIDDHPLSSLFKSKPSSTEPPPSSTEPPPSSTEPPLETPYKPHGNKYIYTALTREEFMREIDGGYNGEAFKEFDHLSETEIKHAAAECWDFLVTELKEPQQGSACAYVRRYISNGIRLKKIRKNEPKKVSAGEEIAAKHTAPEQEWHKRARNAFGEALYQSWIRPLWFDGEHLCAPSKFIADWVRDHYRDELRPFVDADIIHKPYQPEEERQTA